MGYETEGQTAVYLDELDDQPVADEINRALSFKKEARKNVKRKGLR
jgi:hypothetical protein